MIKKRNYNDSNQTIYECDRCKEEVVGSDNIYRIGIQKINKQRTIKSMHLCPRCTKIFLYFVKKGVQKK